MRDIKLLNGGSDDLKRVQEDRGRQSYPVIDALKAVELEQFTSGTEIKAMCRNTNQSPDISFLFRLAAIGGSSLPKAVGLPWCGLPQSNGT